MALATEIEKLGIPTVIVQCRSDHHQEFFDDTRMLDTLHKK